MAYSAGTLKQIAVVNSTPDGIQGGVWHSGGGLAAEKRDATMRSSTPLSLTAAMGDAITANHEYLNDRDLDLSQPQRLGSVGCEVSAGVRDRHKLLWR
jgi:hypothetical protein